VAVSAAGVLPACPASQGLVPPPPGHALAFRTAAIRVVNRLYATSRSWDLRHTDRTMWPEVVAMWRSGDAPLRGGIDRSDFPVLLSGPLEPGPDGRLSLYRLIRQSCDPRVMRSSFLVVNGPPDGQSLQKSYLFVNRNGHPLLYFVY
jgi:hypothetical protein